MPTVEFVARQSPAKSVSIGAMNRNASGLWASLLGAGLFLSSSRALAPPICAGRLVVENEVLALKVRTVTIDGAPAAIPSQTYTLQSGCALQALDGTLLDPDDPLKFRSTLWGLETAP